MPLLSLATSSHFHHVTEYPQHTRTTPVPALSKETPTLGQTSRAQYLATACQARGDRAPTQSWTRQSAKRSSTLVLPLHAYLCLALRQPPLYAVDMPTGSRTPRHRRNDPSSAAPVLRTLERRQPAIVLPSLPLHARRTLHDPSNLARPLACPFAAPDAGAMDDLPRAPAAPQPPIKGELPRSNLSHQQVALIPLILLNTFPSSISLPLAGI
jgi:hypothetical protein